MFVYWIHLPEQTDVTTQGYVGITHDFEQRMFAHKSCAKTGKKQTLYKAIRKYGWDNLIKEIILIGDEQYCLEIEKKLRPVEHMAWNIAMGGAEIVGINLKGRKQSEAHLHNRKKALIGRVSGFADKKHTKEAIEKTMLFVRGIPKTKTTKQKIALAKSKKIQINGVIYPSWKEASKSTGIPMGSISYLLKNKPVSGKWATFDLQKVM
jgi:predicted GIY-YIG superfamily endonuclease